MNDYTLEDFRQWCEGKGRDEDAGRHWPVLDAIERFKRFKESENGRTDAQKNPRE